MSNTNLVKYGEWSLEQAQEEAETSAKLGGSGVFYKFKDGRNTLRFMPPKLGTKSPFLVVMEHYINVPGVQRPVVFACPLQMAKKPCPACQEVEALRATGNPADNDAAYEMSAKLRAYANAINREEPERGPVIVGMPKTIYDGLVSLRSDPDGGGDFTNPETGFDIIITRTGGGGKRTKYEVRGSRKQTPLGNVEWIDMQHNLSGRGLVRNYEDLRAALDGEEDTRGGSSRRAAAPAPAPRAAAAPKRRTADDDILDAEIDEEPFTS